MKSINRRALAALVFGFLTLGTGSAFAGETEKAHGCCARESSCCSAGCCTDAQAAVADNQTEARFKAKYGREYPLKKSVSPTASQSCCKHC